MTTIVMTREQYMAPCKGLTQLARDIEAAARHRTYYGQFVTPATIQRVVVCIGRDRILSSTDPHFNDIPLHLWDHLVPALPGSGQFAEAGDTYTLGGGVCLAKEAARQWREQYEAATQNQNSET
jgi:hypothetical protein